MNTISNSTSITNPSKLTTSNNSKKPIVRLSARKRNYRSNSSSKLPSSPTKTKRGFEPAIRSPKDIYAEIKEKFVLLKQAQLALHQDLDARLNSPEGERYEAVHYLIRDTRVSYAAARALEYAKLLTKEGTGRKEDLVNTTTLIDHLKQQLLTSSNIEQFIKQCDEDIRLLEQDRDLSLSQSNLMQSYVNEAESILELIKELNAKTSSTDGVIPGRLIEDSKETERDSQGLAISQMRDWLRDRVQYHKEGIAVLTGNTQDGQEKEHTAYLELSDYPLLIASLKMAQGFASDLEV